MSYLPIYKTLKQSPAVVAILGAEPRVYEDIAPVGNGSLCRMARPWW